MVEPPRDWSPTKRSRPLSFALPSSPSSSTFSFNSRPLSPDLNNASTGARTRPSHRSTASLSSLAQLNLNSSSSSTSAHSPVVRSPNSLERSPSLHWGTFSTPQQSTAMSNSAASASSNGVGKEFEHVQNKTFAKWLNARLEPHGYPIVQDLGQDFSDGTRLIQLVEVLTEQSLGRYNQAPVLRVQKMENTKLALDRIKEIGVHLTNIGPEDIVDGNRKLILGMIWSLVLRFSIADINEEGSHAKDGLLLWCQRKTNGYDRVDVKDFTKSWVDGLAFCALIHRHRPDLLDYSKLATKEPSMPNSIENLELAFSIAERHLGIPRLLDVEDVCGTTRTYNGKPDERSLMTYVAQFFHAFSSKAQQETEARVISNFVEHMSELMLSVHDYERRLTLLLSSISAHLETLSALPSPEQTPYGTLLTLISSFTCSSRYLSTRSSWASERLELHLLLFRIGEKLKTYGLRAYEPPEGLRLIDLDDKWDSFQERERAHVGRFKRQVEKLRRAAEEHVKRLTESIERGLNEFELEVVTPKRGTTTSSRTGVSLETQLDHLQHVVSSSDRIVRLRRQLDELDQAEAQCIAYDIPVPLLPLSSASPLSIAENETHETSTSKSSERRSRVDTIHSASGLRNEFEQLEKQLTNKISFIENQIVARRTTSLKPEQLEEFESAFRAFDKEGTNRLGLDELVGALGSLGVAEINLEEIQQDEEDQVSFEEFIRFLSARAEDRLTGEKVRSCFRSVASEKGYVTELDLTRLELPTKSLQFLKEHMPQSRIEVPETTTAGVGGRADDVQTSTREEVVLDWEGFLSQFLE